MPEGFSGPGFHEAGAIDFSAGERNYFGIPLDIGA